jgi:hypothetical protein
VEAETHESAFGGREDMRAAVFFGRRRVTAKLM